MPPARLLKNFAFENIPSTAVDDSGVVYLAHPFPVIVEMGMDVAMQEIGRLEPVDKVMKKLKSPVTAVFSIVDMARRSMADYNVHPLLSPEGKVQFPDEHSHLCFMILVRTAIIPS